MAHLRMHFSHTTLQVICLRAAYAPPISNALVSQALQATLFCISLEQTVVMFIHSLHYPYIATKDELLYVPLKTYHIQNICCDCQSGIT